MSEIHGPNQTQAVVKLCPACSSPSIHFPMIGSKRAQCVSCGWEGITSELIGAPFKHEMGSNEAVLQSMVADLRNLLAENFGLTFGQFLRKWGFLPETITAKELSQYVVAVAKATLTSILETREKIEKDRRL